MFAFFIMIVLKLYKLSYANTVMFVWGGGYHVTMFVKFDSVLDLM